MVTDLGLTSPGLSGIVVLPLTSLRTWNKLIQFSEPVSSSKNICIALYGLIILF